MQRSLALTYVSYCLDDSLNVRTGESIPDNARLVGWQCGFEPMFVAVWSYLPGVELEDDEAAEIAVDYLLERKWFSDDQETAPDYII